MSNELNCNDYTKKVYLTKKSVVAEFAKHAIWASPYTYPDNLLEAIDEVNKQYTCVFDHEDFHNTTYQEIYDQLEKICENTPYIVAWNTPKNPALKDQTIFYSDRYSTKRNPDDDFIDLGALVNNIVHGLFDRQIRNEQHDE